MRSCAILVEPINHKMKLTVRMKKERFKATVAAALLLIQNGKILLMRRANTGFGDGLYGLPGGSIEGNEPIKTALIRESNEELGITLLDEDVLFSSVLHIAPHFRTPSEVFLFGFRCEKFQGTVENKEPDKCDDLSFFLLDQLPENILEGSKQMIFNLLSGSHFSELHWQ